MSDHAPGFQGMLKGVGLLELVQFFSHNGNTCAVEVVNGVGRGMLYFLDGRLVHAQAGEDLVGEAAAITVLGWGNGQFHVLAEFEPPYKTIECPTQAILLRVAQSADECSAGGEPGAIQGRIAGLCEVAIEVGEEFGFENFRGLEAYSQLRRYTLAREGVGEVVYTSESLFGYEPKSTNEPAGAESGVVH